MDRLRFIANYAKADGVLNADKDKIVESFLLDKPVDVGKGTQNLIVCMEELAELQQQLSKYLRGMSDKYSLLEEVADVCLSIECIKMVCNITDEEINKALNVKLDRIKARVEADKFA